MPLNLTRDTVIIAHDYLCPWCWIGLFQAQRLHTDLPQIRQDWRGYELLPEALGPMPEFKPRPRDLNAPPTRLDKLAELDGIPIPQNRTIGAVRTHDALQGAEWFKEKEPAHFDAYNEGVYRAFWERSEDISNIDVLSAIVEKTGLAPGRFADAVRTKAYSSKVVGFDDDAYAADITHVPTFTFRGERCAEAPYTTIKEMAERFIAWYGPK